MSIISWLEQLWGIQCYEIAERVGQTTTHPANYTYFLEAANCVTTVGVIVVAALVLLIAKKIIRGR